MNGAPGFNSTAVPSSGIGGTHGDDRIRDKGAGSSDDPRRAIHPDPVGDEDGLQGSASVEPSSDGIAEPALHGQGGEDREGPEGPLPGGLRGPFNFKTVPPRKRACDNCPFRPDSALAKSLGEQRVGEFKNTVESGGWFPCHKSSSTRLELQEDMRDMHTSEWDWLPLEERLAILTKEQECVGGRIWRDEHRPPRPDEIDT